jgi:hypothetical protein
MPQPSRSRPPEQARAGALLEQARRWSSARVNYDRATDVSSRCPQCEGLVTRRLGPGVLCGTCGRLWIVREMLEREAGIEGAA